MSLRERLKRLEGRRPFPGFGGGPVHDPAGALAFLARGELPEGWEPGPPPPMDEGEWTRRAQAHQNTLRRGKR